MSDLNVQHIETEQKIIHLMLKNLDSIKDVLESGDILECFTKEHQRIISAIFKEFLNSKKTRKLSRDAYSHYLKTNNLQDDYLNDLRTYDQCLHTAYARPDDVGVLKTQLFENYIGRQSAEIFSKFKDDVKKNGHVMATTLLVDKLNNSIKLTRARKKAAIRTIKDLKETFLADYEHKRDHPGDRITCGLPEIDDCMSKGFKPMQMTLFVGEPGGHKTNVMLNIGLNISDKGHNVMFIALEMSAEDLMTRIIANRVNMNSHLLENPAMAPTSDIEKIRAASLFDNSRFAILDGERFTVSEIENMIEKYSPIFKPKVVIIDYVAIMKSEHNFYGRNDLEIGEILKSLRFLGQKHDFHIITAAQMGRATIKALKENKDDAVDSTSVAGSAQYSNDSDNIFALIKIPNETDRIKLNVVKARHGPSGMVLELRVDPAFYRVTSTQMSQELIDRMNNNLEADLNIPIDEIQKSVKKPSIDFAGMDFGDDTPKTDDDLASLGI